MRGLKQKDAALRIGVSTQTFNNWMFREVFPDFDYLQKLAEVLNTTTNELIDNKEATEPLLNYKNKSSNNSSDRIPLYTEEPSTNRLNFWTDETTEDPKDFIIIPGLKADFIFVYYGSGMEPSISNGDWIALRRINDYSFFNFGEIHLIITEEQVLVRTIRKGNKKGTLLLTSENDFIDNIEIPTKSIRAIFIIVTIIKRVVL